MESTQTASEDTHTRTYTRLSHLAEHSLPPPLAANTRDCAARAIVCVCVCVPVSYCSAGLAEEATSWGTNREHQLLSLPKHTHRVAAHCCSSGSRQQEQPCPQRNGTKIIIKKKKRSAWGSLCLGMSHICWWIDLKPHSVSSVLQKWPETQRTCVQRHTQRCRMTGWRAAEGWPAISQTTSGQRPPWCTVNTHAHRDTTHPCWLYKHIEGRVSQHEQGRIH